MRRWLDIMTAIFVIVTKNKFSLVTKVYETKSGLESHNLFFKASKCFNDGWNARLIFSDE